MVLWTKTKEFFLCGACTQKTINKIHIKFRFSNSQRYNETYLKCIKNASKRPIKFLRSKRKKKHDPIKMSIIKTNSL